jgi:hypothetical protein
MREIFVVQWQSPAMSAPAFWYYRSNNEATIDGLTLQRRGCGIVMRRWDCTEAEFQRVRFIQ